MMNKNKVTVKQQTEVGSKNFGVYISGRLVEGGFFSRGAAESCANNWRTELAAEQSIMDAQAEFEDRFLASMER